MNFELIDVILNAVMAIVVAVVGCLYIFHEKENNRGNDQE